MSDVSRPTGVGDDEARLSVALDAWHEACHRGESNIDGMRRVLAAVDALSAANLRQVRRQVAAVEQLCANIEESDRFKYVAPFVTIKAVRAVLATAASCSCGHLISEHPGCGCDSPCPGEGRNHANEA